MGLFDKVKNLFTEEVDEPEEKVVRKEPNKEIKKEIFKQERTVEIAPARKETADFFEKELEEEKKDRVEKIEVKETKNSNILFSDDAFSDLPSRREERTERPRSFTRDIYSEINTRKYEPKKIETKKEEKKVFKPSPIISPVYGVLDKNYKKEEISSKVRENPYKSDVITVDDVRNKAFGTLEDELENTLINKALIVNNNTVEEPDIDIFGELETKEAREESEVIADEIAKQRQQIEEINEIIKTSVSPENKKVTSRKIDNILEELDEIEELIPKKNKKEEIEDTKTEEPIEDDYIEEPIEDDFIDEEPKVVEHKKIEKTAVVEDNNDELEEGDLFNLIDSMYEKRDE